MKLLKTAFLMVLISTLPALAIAQGFTGVIQINRQLGGSELRSPTDPATHTFVAYVDNGIALATATCGDNSMLLGRWALNTLTYTDPQFSHSSVAIAQAALDQGLFVVVRAGGTYEHFYQAYLDTNSGIPHPNLGFAFSCKWAAWVFGNNYHYVSTGTSAPTVFDAPNPAYTDTGMWMEMHLHPAYWMALNTSPSALQSYNIAVETQSQLRDKLK